MSTLRSFNWVSVSLVLLSTSAGAFTPQDPDAMLDLESACLTTYQASSASSNQDVRPPLFLRGVAIDGTRRSATPGSLALAGNPFSHGNEGSGILGGVALSTGSFVTSDVDLRLPSVGLPWVVGRSYSAIQKDSGSSHHDSSGPQGNNWFQTSMPELVFYDGDANKEASDLIYLVGAADRYFEFKRVAENSDIFRGINGTAGVIEHQENGTSEPDLFVLTGQNGNQLWFFGTDGDAGNAAGQLWKMLDTADASTPNVTYVGDATTASTAITNGYVSGSGRISTAYDASDRRYSYTYDGNDRLTEVEAETKTGGTWASPTGLETVGKVNYTYYDGTTSYGSDGDLEFVKITIPMTDSGVEVVKRRYLRYYKGTFNAGSNPGHDHGLKYVYDFEGVRNYDYGDNDIDDADLRAASNANLELYASAYFEYDSSHRIVAFWTSGACGCSGAADGRHDVEYESNGSFSDTSGYDDDWYSRTIVARPDGSYVTQYFDEVGQPLSRVITDIDPDSTSPAPEVWATHVDRNASGIITSVHTPANVTGYTHSSASFTTSTSAGLVWSYSLVASSNTEEGYISDRKYKEGTSGSAYLDKTWTYDYETFQVDGSETKSKVVRPWIASTRDYTQAITSGTTGSNLWSRSMTFHGATDRLQLAIKEITETDPAVSTSKNGSGSSTERKRYLNKDQSLAFEKSAGGTITYREYGTYGQLSKLIEDADTTKTGTGEDFESVNVPSGFSSSGSPLHRVSAYTYDAQGRRDEVVANSRTRKSYYSVLGDDRLVMLSYQDYETGPEKFYGPVSAQIQNHAGRPECTMTVALTSNETTSATTAHVDETDDDPITAMDLGTVARMSTSEYNETGMQVEESRAYFSIPASGDGTDGTHYDPALYGYDDSGHPWRVKQSHGTISRTVYDKLGRVTERWIGTNDSSFTGGEGSGTDNMVKVESMVYDSGNDKGNSLVTTRTVYVEDSTTDKRETSYEHDVRGNVLLETGPGAPYAFHKYDNMDRSIATGQFSSTGNIVIGTDDPTTETTNRLALSQAFYDERGQVWKSQRHEIDASDGSDDDNLQSLTWYDADQRVLKRDGSTLQKIQYDGLGRQTHRYVLAKDNDSTYAHADDVTGDIVLEEYQTIYDGDDGGVIMQAVIQRFHDDYGIGQTTGALDTNADGDDLKYTASDLEGRIQITAMWNGLQGVTDEVRYGTYGGSTFDRDGLSVPSRSDTALRTSYTYDTDGTLLEVEDPKGLVARYEYDDLGRKTKEIRSYDASVNSGNPSGTDDNQTVKYEYTDGLESKITADLPSGQTDQETTYEYGTTKGVGAGDSKIATGHLLQKVTYPDSASGSDVVTYAYNAQFEQIWTQDQAGNVIETDFGDTGLEDHHRVTTLASGFDGDVRRISTTYTDLGQVELVTQYDNATVGSGAVVNEVKFTYDGWGNVETYEEDRNSAVGASGSVDDYEVSYTYNKATTGRNTVRRTGATLPSGNVLTYQYILGHDSVSSRPSRIKDGSVILASYDYLGVGSVVGINHPVSDIMWEQYTTAGAYPDLDNFNRVTSSRWTKDLSTDVDFYDCDITYDRNGNPTVIEDHVHEGYDVSYTIDDLDRVTRAQEGTWGGSTISSETRDQEWTLSHTGNWDLEKLDLNGDGDWSDSDEHEDDRTHNDVNELTGRDTDDNGTDDYTLTYDGIGNLTDDGENYKYVYDAFGRLREVLDRSDDSLVGDYIYNGQGHLISIHQDTDTDGDVDGNDKWYHTAYDERWRPLATFREDDTDPKEEFVLHQAGADGKGASSYINAIVCRYRDHNTSWTSASDAVLERIDYYCQNWRGDVSGLITDGGAMVEWAKYLSYGAPIGLPFADTDSDGDRDLSDVNAIQSIMDVSGYDVRGDLDLDGDVDSNDKSTSSGSTVSLGLWSLSDVGCHHGRSGYSVDRTLSSIRHVRHRALNLVLGRWLNRDPMGYYEGPNLLSYCGGHPVASVDPMGLADDDVFAGLEFDCGQIVPWAGQARGNGFSLSSAEDAEFQCAKDMAESIQGSIPNFSCPIAQERCPEKEKFFRGGRIRYTGCEFVKEISITPWGFETKFKLLPPRLRVELFPFNPDSLTLNGYWHSYCEGNFTATIGCTRCRRVKGKLIA